jgi:hypothetical protein
MIERNRVGERCGVGIVLVVGSGVVGAEAAAVGHLPGSPGIGAAAVLGDRLLVFIVWALTLAGEKGDPYRRRRGGAAARPARRGVDRGDHGSRYPNLALPLDSIHDQVPSIPVPRSDSSMTKIKPFPSRKLQPNKKRAFLLRCSIFFTHRYGISSIQYQLQCIHRQQFIYQNTKSIVIRPGSPTFLAQVITSNILSTAVALIPNILFTKNLANIQTTKLTLTNFLQYAHITVKMIPPKGEIRRESEK